jgi:hypothetical protein
LQRKGENLRLKFEAHHYGPYAVQLNHVLQYLNGTFLQGLEQNTAKPFEPITLNYQKLSEVKSFVERSLNPGQHRRLAEVAELIKGFESTFALELLATVDFVKAENKDDSIEAILHKISEWSKRKTKLFKQEYIEIANKRLAEHSAELSFN